MTNENKDLKASKAKHTDGLNVAERSYTDLQKSLEKSQMNVLDVRDMDFDQAKDQELCLYPELDISPMDFFKNIMDGKLVDVEADEDGN